MEPAHEAQEGLLNQVFGQRPIAGEEVREPDPSGACRA